MLPELVSVDRASSLRGQQGCRVRYTLHRLGRRAPRWTRMLYSRWRQRDTHVSHVGITQPIVRTLNCAGVLVDMQVDTGSPVSVITWPTYEHNKTMWPKLRGSPLKLTCFLGRLPVRGQLKLNVLCGNRSTEGSLTVLGCSGPNLCGRSDPGVPHARGASHERECDR
ncbi:uncharacterized protein LOC125947442 [Dermacentor silvarum]|uniref:uncharacterized protein LOC125947442 n=1 Tax=Dermacentor silvarum TaxID=543639 RepID=UPI0021015FCC|nr:uncharacterized protein LOC125947442 [Dermacentor silvarum]